MNAYKLVREDGTEVRRGAKLKSFRGETWTFIDFAAPTREGSTGRVHVRRGKETMSYYPSVFDCKIVEV